ncbi:MAG: Zn-dependent exopeptidase M28 [Firmicutes bacterium]|nr:Zn-dependent exopeptidase M28 [Bacillota bacterium]
MRKKVKCFTSLIIIFLVFSVAACVNSNDQPLESYIDVDRALETIQELTLPKYGGRLTGTEGNALTVDYIAEYFQSIGLESHHSLTDYRQGYEQKVILTEATPELSIVNPTGDAVKEFKFAHDFQFMTFWPGLKIEGDVQGEIAVIKDEPTLNDIQSYADKFVIIDQPLIPGGHPDGPHAILQKILASDYKVKGIIFNLDSRLNDSYNITPNIYQVVTDYRQTGFNNDDGPFVLYCTQDVFDELAGAADDNLELSVSAYYIYKDAEVANVIGIIPGVDEELQDNAIIIGAHLDHVGENKDGTYQPGALDNASGVAAMMEIAGTLQAAGFSPDKSIVFVAFNGEEMGLFGSTNYVNNPLFPLTKTTVINMDMVGSKEEVPLTIMSDRERFRKQVYEFALDRGIDCTSEIGVPSDHIPFVLRGVDALTLIHMDRTHIHTYNDTMENIDRNRLEEVIRLVIAYIEEAAFEK